MSADKVFFLHKVTSYVRISRKKMYGYPLSLVVNEFPLTYNRPYDGRRVNNCIDTLLEMDSGS